MKNVEELIKQGDATVIDVRTPAEFMGGHVPGSVNIPLQEIPSRLEELKGMKNIVLCCASGNRSGQAAAFLEQHGIECVNGGSWMDVNYFKNSK
jgi:rhodanese-related sulfurtransferase